MPKLKTNDPLWRELKTKGVVKPNASKNLPDTPEGPYYVGWTAQSHEWYGDKGPEHGQGRYKAKGNGGTILARDIQSYEQAKKIAANLDKSHEQGKFYDKSVYGKMGKDWYVNDYHGAYVGSHSKAKAEDNEDQWDLEYQEKIAKATGKRNRPTSFANFVGKSMSKAMKESYNRHFDPTKYDAKDFVEPMKDPVRVGLNGVVERQAAKLKYGVFGGSKQKARLKANPHFKVSK